MEETEVRLFSTLGVVWGMRGRHNLSSNAGPRNACQWSPSIAPAGGRGEKGKIEFANASATQRYFRFFCPAPSFAIIVVGLEEHEIGGGKEEDYELVDG